MSLDLVTLALAKKYADEKVSGGSHGKDGTSATHSWNGTVLTITSASGTSSAELKGDKGDTGPAPIRGTDYWTEEDKAAILQEVLAALPTWTGGSY